MITVSSKNMFESYNEFSASILDTNTKPPECVDIIRVHHEVFTAGALEARVLRTSDFRAPAGKTKQSDVLRIMSTQEGSFVFIIHPT